MKYIDLIAKLTPEEKETIHAYINKFGCRDKYFQGIDKWLQAWSHSNQKLYHMLGDSFIKEYDYTYEKTSSMFDSELDVLFYDTEDELDFYKNWNEFIDKIVRPSKIKLRFYADRLMPDDEDREVYEKYHFTEDDCDFFYCLFSKQVFRENKIIYGIKYKKPGANKILQIQAGAKPIKAINKVIEYFKDDYNFNLKALEYFRQRLAIILSEKQLHGKLCVSIHPMDFMTMSDNDANWSSCMSWSKDGCYHVGTVEMMNSNNVVCCYLTHDNYVFDGETINPETGEILGAWNNKRWRQLFYVTKDIIMGGKPYPYVNESMTLALLEQIKELTHENLKWDYKFGPELYLDMVHIGSAYRMDKQREWMRAKSKVKNNIIWDTKGMYNDMLNDHNTDYWCYRNKTEHTKIISVSGKSPCLCCGENVATFDECADEYNDRYNNTGRVICERCCDKYFYCDICDEVHPGREIYMSANGQRVCEDCLRHIAFCPDCGQLFDTYGGRRNDIYYSPALYSVFDRNPDYQFESGCGNDFDSFTPLSRGYDKNWLDNRHNKDMKDLYENWDGVGRITDREFSLERIYCCNECKNKLVNDNNKTKEITIPGFWSIDKRILINPRVAEKYRCFNLKMASKEDIKNLNVED